MQPVMASVCTATLDHMLVLLLYCKVQYIMLVSFICASWLASVHQHCHIPNTQLLHEITVWLMGHSHMLQSYPMPDVGPGICGWTLTYCNMCASGQT